MIMEYSRYLMRVGILAAALILVLEAAPLYAAEGKAVESAAKIKFYSLDGPAGKSGKIYRMPKTGPMKFAPYPLGQRHNLEKYSPSRKSEASVGTTQMASAGDANSVILALFDEDPAASLD